MIIQIRGTSGAGKTHLVRRLMGAAGGVSDLHGPHPVREGKTLLMGHHAKDARVFFVGGYDTTCGGCDKFSWKGAADWVQSLITKEAQAGSHVVFEGVLVSQWKTARFLQLGRVAPLTAILLDTPLADCLAAVQGRRVQRGNDADLNPASTTDKHNHNLRKMPVDREAGVNVQLMSREQAYLYCCDALGLGAFDPPPVTAQDHQDVYGP